MFRCSFSRRAITFLRRSLIATGSPLEWDLNLVNVLPEHTVAEQESQFGILYQSAPDRCCGMRKVEPLFRSLAPYEVWVTGLRRQQSKSRANLQAEETLHACLAATRLPS